MAKAKTAAEKKKEAKGAKDQLPAKERRGKKHKAATTTPRGSLPDIQKKGGASARTKQVVPSGVTTTPAPRKGRVVLNVLNSSSDEADDEPLLQQRNVKRQKLAGDNALPVAAKPDDGDDEEEEEEEELEEELEDEDVGNEGN